MSVARIPAPGPGQDGGELEGIADGPREGDTRSRRRDGRKAAILPMVALITPIGRTMRKPSAPAGRDRRRERSGHRCRSGQGFRASGKNGVNQSGRTRASGGLRACPARACPLPGTIASLHGTQLGLRLLIVWILGITLSATDVTTDTPEERT